MMFFNKKKKDEDPEDIFEDELISKVNEGHEQGALRTREATMIQNILSLDEKDAKDIMIHRPDIEAMNGEMTLSEAIDLCIEKQYSRYPVFLEDLDNIIGLVHIKDILSFTKRTDLYGTRIRDIDGLLRPTESVPETHGIDTLFTTMQIEKSHMVIVVDEYGQTSGIIAMEDILEEIVGNILDEYDEEEESVEVVNKDTWIMNGHTPLSEASEGLGITFDDEYETLNGFLISRIDRIPREHETFRVEYKGYVFSVRDVVSNVIGEVAVRKLPPPFGGEPRSTG